MKKNGGTKGNKEEEGGGEEEEGEMRKKEGVKKKRRGRKTKAFITFPGGVEYGLE